MLELHTEYSGKEFNEYHNQRGTKFYKFLNNDLKHYGFEYGLGLNTDTKPFNPNGDCLGGGLYFCEESKCHNHYGSYGTKIALIEIPDDARVYIEHNKFKSDRLFIKEILDFATIGDSFWINIIPNDCSVLQYVKNQTDDICRLAIQENGYALYYVREQTEELCILSVQQNGNVLYFVKEQTNEICIQAVQQNGIALQFVKEQTNDICIMAVQQNGLALQFVENQTDEICILAVQQNGKALQFVKEQTDEICKLAMQQNDHVLRFVRILTPEMCRLGTPQYFMHMPIMIKSRYSNI